MTNPVSVPRELLPCPFCGGKAKKSSESLGEHYGYAKRVTYRCTGCGCERGAVGDTSKPGYADNSTVEQRALDAWNRRAAPAAAPSQVDVRDAERLDFMLCNHRKVVVERIPGGRLEIYVEEGFMGDKEYPSVKHRGEWRDGSEAANAIKRAAIDKALAHQHEQEKGDE